MPNRRIRHDGNAPLPTPWLQIPLDASMRQVVQQLIGSDLITARQSGRLLHVVDVKITYAILQDLSRFFQ